MNPHSTMVRTAPERALAVQYDVAQVLASAETLSQATRKILQVVCENLHWEIGAFWNVDRKAQVIRCEDFWRREQTGPDEFEVATRGCAFAAGEGIPGRVWASGKPVWISDVLKDANFPRSPMAKASGLRAGFAFPIRLDAAILGVLEFYCRETRAPDDTLLRVFAAIGGHIGQFIERRRAEEMIKAIAAGTASATGMDFFQSLVSNLARALEVRYAFVAECQGSARERARSRAFWNGDGFGENFEYDVATTPCRTVLEGKTAIYPDCVAALFPDDPDLTAIGAQSYIGLPLLDHAREVIGHLAVLDTHPLDGVQREVSVLQAFASRAGAELERVRAQEREHALLELNNSIITRLQLSQLLHAVREALRRVIAHDRAAIAIYEREADDLRVYALDGSFAPDQLVVGQLLDVRGEGGAAPFNFHEPLLRNDLETERRYAFDEGLLAAGMRSHAALPLKSAGRTIGILGISSRRRNQFSRADFAFLQEVANQIALAIANVQAYEEIAALKAKLQAENVYLRSELIANVSHDLRTPLASLRGYLETLLMKPDLPEERRKNYLEIATHQSKRLSELVEELFELAKLDFKGFQLNREPLKLDELARDVVQKFELAADAKKIRFAIVTGPNIPYVQGDIGLIERAFENLIENALRHSYEGGEVAVAISSGNGRVEVKIVDRGSGIAEEDLPHVFERFYRGDKSRSSGGAGLGLAITKRIIELHGSQITATSSVEKGTCFAFALPVD